jgi:glycosyltransferase involved in cell wall biosynthesis
VSLLFVTKPFAPPWHDSSSGLARTLVHGLLAEPDHPAIRVLVGDRPSGFSGLTEERIYGASGHFAPGLRQNLPVLLRLFRRRGERARHFFFAPNPRTAKAARLASLLRPVPAVQTLCSLPSQGVAIAPSLFARTNVVVSAWAQRRLAAEGLDLPLIEPAVLPLSRTETGRQSCRERFGDYLLFAGDLRDGGGAEQALKALKLLPEPLSLVIASRPKTEADQGLLQALKDRVVAAGLSNRVHFLGRIDWIGDLVAAARAQLLPATDLTGKMDFPLVLLEGFEAGVPAVVAAESPIAEIDDEALGKAPAADATGLASEVERVLALEPRVAEALYKRRFLPSRMASQYRALYRAEGLIT